eukprot:3698188-Alexandrium_andersonii.AAC.1
MSLSKPFHGGWSARPQVDVASLSAVIADHFNVADKESIPSVGFVIGLPIDQKIGLPTESTTCCCL